jgi:ubiquinone biosynthesis protein UbiJ
MRARMEEIRGLLADAEKLERARGFRDEIAALAPYEGDVWRRTPHGDALASFNAETHRIKTRSATVQARLSELSAQAREARAQAHRGLVLRPVRQGRVGCRR